MRLRTAPVELKICPVCSIVPSRADFGSAIEVADWGGVDAGTHVVHTFYGVGMFRGIQVISAAGVDRSSLAVEYADGALVYVTDDWSGRVRLCRPGNYELAALGVAHRGVVEYEGSGCPHCHTAFHEDTVRKTYDDRLILIGSEIPRYTLHEAFKCPQCANIYDITRRRLHRKARCRRCGRELMTDDEVKAVLSERTTRREAAVRMTQALAGYLECRDCYPGGAAVSVCWCPMCDRDEEARTSPCLPKQSTKIWRRTNYIIKPVEEIPEHHQPGAEDPALIEILNSTYGGETKLGSGR